MHYLLHAATTKTPSTMLRIRTMRRAAPRKAKLRPIADVRRFSRTSRGRAVRLRPRAGIGAGAEAGVADHRRHRNRRWTPARSMREFSSPRNIDLCMRPSASILMKRSCANTRMSEWNSWREHPKVIAWGEIGLDYYYDHSPRDMQQKVFLGRWNWRAAKLPIVIHCRPSDNSENAWEDCLRLIGDNGRRTGLGGILHCFTGTWLTPKRALDMGFMISFAGNITFPKAQQIRDAAQEVPLDRMFIETDCPYLAPIPYRGKRNEPAYVKETARNRRVARNVDGGNG